MKRLLKNLPAFIFIVILTYFVNKDNAGYVIVGLLCLMLLIGLGYLALIKWDDYQTKKLAADLQNTLNKYANTTNKRASVLNLCMRLKRVINFANVRRKEGTLTTTYMKKWLRLVKTLNTELKNQIA